MLDVAVRRRLGTFQLDAAFTADAGVTALFGRSGAGKTSLVNLIAGLAKPDGGRIVVGGRVLYDAAAGIDVPPRQRRIGYVFQEGRLFPHLTVRQNLLYGRWFTPRSERYGGLEPVVELLGIRSLLKRRPADLSGGEKQRVAIGRALLASPRLLLLDEPLASLDAARKGEILPYVERLRDEMRLPIVYVSHSIEEVVRLAGTLVVMSAGRVEATGPASEVMSRLDLRPLTGRYEAGAVIDATVAGQLPTVALTRLAFSGGELVVPAVPLAPGSPVRVRVRARDVAIALAPPEGVSIQNILPVRVLEISEEPGTFAELRLGAGAAVILARLTRQAVRQLALAPGQSVHALIKTVALDRHSLGLPAGPVDRVEHD